MVNIRHARITRSLVACTLLLVLGTHARAQNAATSDGKPATTQAVGAGEPKSCKVEVGPIKVEATLKGIVEAQRVAEVPLKPEAWTMPLTIERAIEHGTRVKKGDILL